MPATPRDLYNHLKGIGELSITYEQFREKWDEPGWNVDFYNALVKKGHTSLNYEDFIFTFSDSDPDYDQPGVIELSDEELEGKDPAEPKPQGEAAEDGDSSGENISWASPEKIAKIRQQFGGQIAPDEPITDKDYDQVMKYIENLDKREIASEEKINNIRAAYGGNEEDARKAELSTKELDDIQKYVEKMSKVEIPEEPRTIGDRAAQAFFINMPLGLEKDWESTKIYAADWAAEVIGPDFTDWIQGKDIGQSGGFVDPVTNEVVKYSENPERFKELNRLNMHNDVHIPYRRDDGSYTGEATDAYIIDQFKKIQGIDEQMTDPGGIVKGFKEGDLGEIAGGTFSAVQGLISTLLPAIATGGASLYPQVVAPMWVDYNTTKAMAKYGDQEDPISSLVLNDDTDFIVPTILGLGAVALEKIGLKGISKYMAGTKVGQQIMGIPTNKVAFILTGNKEGGTEWLQSGLETMNQTLASGGSFNKSVKDAANAMFSEEGLENYLKGFVGTSVISGPTAINRTIQRALHEDPDGHQIITGGIEAITELKERRARAQSPQLKKIYDKDIAEIEKAMKQVLRANNKLIKHLTKAERKKLVSIMNRKDQIAKDIQSLDDALAKGEISAKERGYTFRRLNAENAKLSQEIADLKENIDTSKIQTDIETAKKLSKKIGNTEVYSIKTESEAREVLQGKVTQQGTEFDEARSKDFFDNSYGVFFTDQDGKTHIVINEDAASKDKVTTTARHEFLHRILAKTVEEDPNRVTKMGEELTPYLKEVLGDKYDSSNYAQRVAGYNQELEGTVQMLRVKSTQLKSRMNTALANGTITEEQYQAQVDQIDNMVNSRISEQRAKMNEEKLTLLSEALASGDINLNEGNRGIFERIGDVIRRFLQKLGISQPKLDTAKDVVNFIRDYNKNFDRGTLDKAFRKMAKGFKGTNEVKQSAKNKEDLYQRTENLYEEYSGDAQTAGFMIAMEWENQIRSLVKKYRNLPGYKANVDDLVAEVQTGGSQSVLGLVQSYKPGTKTEDGENAVSLPGYLNKYLPSKIQYHLPRVGIGEIEDQGGFAADVTEQRGLAAEETAEDVILTEEQAAKEQVRKYPTMAKALKLDKNPELTEYLTKRAILNISGNIKKFGQKETINTKTSGFVRGIKKGIQEDEKGAKVIKKFILDYGYEQFLGDFKNVILGNYTTTILSQHPFYRQATQKSIQGVWTSPQQIITNGKVSYDYLMEDGTIYPGRHPHFDRDKMAKTGHTAGHFLIRRAPDVDSAIDTDAFIDYHFMDGPARKKAKLNPLDSMGQQFASETAFELILDQLLKGEGSIYDAFEGRLDLISVVLNDNTIADTIKQLDRGGVKQSKVNKTGFNWFDRPRINMTNYLASLETNSVREGVVNGTIKSPDYDLLYIDMKEAFDMYVGMLEYRDDWTASQQKYADAFQDKKLTFDEFIASTLSQTTSSIDGLLGLQPGDTSFGSKNEGRKTKARNEVVTAFINDKVQGAENKGEALADVINTLVGVHSGSINSALYLNTPGFFSEVVIPAIDKFKIDDVFDLKEIDGGTTITRNGEKITTDFSRGVYSEDTFTMFDEEIAGQGNTIVNTIDAKGRVEEAKRAAKHYKEYIEWLKKNKERISPVSIGMALKGLQARTRSIAHIMQPTTEIMLLEGVDEITEYTTIPSIPHNYISGLAARYILTGENKDALYKAIEEGETAILPKVHAKVVDQFHFNTPLNDFNSEKVAAKLEELGLPQIETTPLLVADQIVRKSDTSIKFSKKVDEKAKAISASAAIGTAKAFSDMINKAGGFQEGTKIPAGIAHLRGKKVDAKITKKYRVFTPEADDFMGLMYTLLGKGKQGDMDKEFVHKTLVEPYLAGIKTLDEIKTNVSQQFKKVLKKHIEISKKLHSVIPGDIKDKFTYDQAIRYYMYNKAGYGDMLEDDIDSKVNVVKNGKKSKLPVSAFTGPSGTKLLNAGVEILPDTPAGAMLNAVLSDSNILEFTEALSAATKLKEGYVKPLETWLSKSSIATDFRDLVGKEYRGKMLKGFITNVELMFTPQNLNKIETAFGTRFRKALYNESPTEPGVIQRMMGGRHAMVPASKLVNWVNGAIAPIMFLNRRSALLQLLSATNFVNWSDNNPLAAAQAFANQKQFTKDFLMILNSPKLRERRAGLKYSVEEAELANIGGADGFWEVFKARTVKLGFSLTQAADSFAIAFGGASFYRNRVNTYMKAIDKNGNKLYTKTQAEEKAWLDFSKTADEAQQSSDQMLLSAEQTRGLGRLILAFANTPAQYTRIMIKAFKDLKNGRGDAKTNISKILYYGAIQNLIFTFVQNAMFATWDIFDGDEDDDQIAEQKLYEEKLAEYKAKLTKRGTRTYTDAEAEKKAQKDVEKLREEKEEFGSNKKERLAKGMADTILRGAGLRGAAISAVYKFALSAAESLDKPMLDTGSPIVEALTYSPPLSAKARQLRSLILSQKYNKEVKDVIGWRYDSPRWMEVGTAVEFTTNLPGTWFGKQLEAAKAITSDENNANAGQKAIIALGWRPYDLGVVDLEFERIKKEVRAKEKARKAEIKAAEKETQKALEKAKLAKRTPAEVKRDEEALKKKNKERAKKAAETRKKNERAKKLKLWEETQRKVEARRKAQN